MAKQKNVKDLINETAGIMFGGDTQALDYNEIIHQYNNRYYNLFMAQFKWKGINKKQENFIMRKFWADGTIAAGKEKVAGELYFTPYAVCDIDMYQQPEGINLVNYKNVPFIPNDKQIVNKDVVIGYIQHNHKGVYSTVNWYVRRIAQVEAVIYTNLQLHKLPYLIPVEPEAKKKAEDVITRILNNEIVVFADIDPDAIQAVQTDAPYIIDKLYDYKQCLENELKTYLGINNNGVEKQEQLQLSEVNANNIEINDSENVFLDCLQTFCKDIKDVLGVDVSVESTSKPVENDGEYHKDGEKTGPKEEDKEEDE